MKNSNDRILKALAIIISINLVVYGVASTASASLLDIAEENEWTDGDVPYEDYEEDLALLFENASGPRFILPFVFATITTYA